MKNVFLVFLIVIITSCGARRPGKLGNAGAKGSNGADGYSLVSNSSVFTSGNVTCNQTDFFQDVNRDNQYNSGDNYLNGFFVCDGAVGAQGIAGNDGTNGVNGVDGQNGTDGIDGSDGEDGETGIAGVNGQNGTNGVDGINGQDGANGNNGVDGIAGTNGVDGQQGIPGLDADITYSVVEIVDPCGDTDGIYDEVILKLGNGKYLSSFSDNATGLNTRFGILTPGSYVTTDGSNCLFTI